MKKQNYLNLEKITYERLEGSERLVDQMLV